jgi:hypothetical protein
MSDAALDTIVPRLVTVWSASVGGGNTERFATRFHGRDLAFRARGDDPRDCIRWVADGVDLGVEPATLGRPLRLQGIYSRASLSVQGLLTGCPIIPLVDVSESDDFEARVARVERALAAEAPTAAWCPAEIQLASREPQAALALVGANEAVLRRLADELGAEDVVVVRQLEWDPPSSGGLLVDSFELIRVRDRSGEVVGERRADAYIGLAYLRPWLEQRNYEPRPVSDGFVRVPNPGLRAI